MKQQENNEIDTLLRNLARRRSTANFGPDSASRDFAARGAHLDVDELSSYAERALPASASARCTAHLADCDDCRKIVAQLSLAAGPLTDERSAEQTSVVGVTWKQRLAALFSPRMIRYAMPALAVILVAVVFFGWRQQRAERPADAVAQNERLQPANVVKPTEQTAANAQSVETRSKPGALAAERDQVEAKAQPTSAPAARADSAKADGESSDEKKPGTEASGSTTASKAGKPEAPAMDKAAGDQPAYAPEPPSPAAKQQTSVAANQEQQKDLAKNSAVDDRERGRDASVQRKGPARNENEVSQRGPAKSEARSAPKMKVAETGATGGAGTEEDEAETRTMFGRRFHRVNNAWVDTAYKSSMSIRIVTRGTESYRALIADEPVIGSIANQLSGEVIVVWKSHAYRIN